jgi:hypothetical protein
MLGINSGPACVVSNNNTFLGYNISLGAGSKVTRYNQLMVATNVTQLGLTALTGTILEFDSDGNILPMAGTHKKVAAIDTAIAAINAPNYFWFTDPTLSGTENNFTPILWGSIVYGNPSNLDTSTGMWTCPTTGLWQFTSSIFCQAYTGYPSWNLYQNGTIFTLIEQASNGTQWLTSVGPFITPAKAGNTFQLKLQFVDDSLPPLLVNSPGCCWQGLMIAPGYTAA